MPSGTSLFRSLNARLGDSQALPILLISKGSLLAALVCVGFGWDLAAGIALIVSTLCEFPLEHRTKALSLLFTQASFGIPVRFTVRILIALLATSVLDDRATRLSLAAGSMLLLAVLCVRVLHTEYRRVGPLKPLRTRGITGNPHIDDAPPANLVLVVGVQTLVLVVAVAGASWWAVLAATLGSALVLAAVTIPSVRASWRMRMAKRKTGFTQPLQQVQNFINETKPEVIVHLSGPGDAAYQINTWLPALEALDRKVLIIIRNLELFERVAQTRLPVLGLPSPGELLMLDFANAKVSLFPANTGDNIHVLRLPELMSAFIGHGDSDKSASNNPFSRAYDELWVAGEAGADRYRTSNLGIDESRYRLVGRPQVDGITQHPKIGESEIPTVLYAPTWEGVNPEQEYSSVRAIGLKLVKQLISDGHVRVIYKPHPFRGQRDPRYRASHADIVRALNEAKASSGIDHRVVRSGAISPWFNEATGLVSDISSVVSDFLASEKPYAVFDHEDIGAKAFREEYPSSAAATIISRNGDGIGEFIDVITDRTPDQLAQYRSKLATYLLGPAEKRTIGSFVAAVEELIARSESERAQYR